MARAAGWALYARVRVGQIVWRHGVAAPVALPDSAGIAPDGLPAVLSVLGRTRATCLVRSLVLQRWLADHGEPVDLVIGVTPPSRGFQAHAWLDRPEETGYEGYTELHRIPWPTAGE